MTADERLLESAREDRHGPECRWCEALRSGAAALALLYEMVDGEKRAGWMARARAVVREARRG